MGFRVTRKEDYLGLLGLLKNLIQDGERLIPMHLLASASNGIWWFLRDHDPISGAHSEECTDTQRCQSLELGRNTSYIYARYTGTSTHAYPCVEGYYGKGLVFGISRLYAAHDAMRWVSDILERMSIYGRIMVVHLSRRQAIRVRSPAVEVCVHNTPTILLTYIFPPDAAREAVWIGLPRPASICISTPNRT